MRYSKSKNLILDYIAENKRLKRQSPGMLLILLEISDSRHVRFSYTYESNDVNWLSEVMSLIRRRLYETQGLRW